MDINRRYSELCAELGDIRVTLRIATEREAQIEMECEVIRRMFEQIKNSAQASQGPTLVKDNESLSK
jgi:hypothetical protein